MTEYNYDIWQVKNALEAKEKECELLKHGIKIAYQDICENRDSYHAEGDYHNAEQHDADAVIMLNLFPWLEKENL